MSTNSAFPGPSGGGQAGFAQPKVQFSLAAKLQRYRLLLLRLWWILFLTVSVAVAGAAWNSLSTPPKYACTGEMMLTGHVAMPDSQSYVEEMANYYGTQTALMKSQTVRKQAELNVQTKHPELKQAKVDIDASQQPKTDIFVFQAVGDQPEYTQELLNETMESYIETKKKMRIGKTDKTLQSVADALSILEKEIKNDDDAVVQFLKNNNIDFNKGTANSAGVYLAKIDNKIADLRAEHDLLDRLSIDQNIQRQTQAIQAMQATQPNQTPSAPAGSLPESSSEHLAPGMTASMDYASAQEDLQKLKAKKAEFEKDLRPKHPIIVELDSQIAQQESLLSYFLEDNKKKIQDLRESKRIEIETYEKERDEWHAKALDMSGRTATYEALQAKTDRDKAQYDHLVSSMQTVDVGKGAEQDVVSILEYASLPIPLKPGVAKTISTAIVGGLIVGLGILFLLDLLDDRLISISEYELQFPERILGRIPHEAVEHRAIINAEDDRHVFCESFSNLRSSVLYLPYDTARPKTILLTSSVPNEGKTTLSSNFAATLALGGAKTLLVDCDLRRGCIRELFDIPAGPGFAEVIAGTVPWREAVEPTGVEKLSLLRSGRHLAQPSKNLLSATVDEFLKEAQAEYDFVVFDSCPVLAADDTTSLAPKLDAVIFVVRLGFSRRATVSRATALLYERQVNVLGAVLNDVNPTVDGYHYYSYSDYYGTPVEE